MEGPGFSPFPATDGGSGLVSAFRFPSLLVSAAMDHLGRDALQAGSHTLARVPMHL